MGYRIEGETGHRCSRAAVEHHRLYVAILPVDFERVGVAAVRGAVRVKNRTGDDKLLTFRDRRVVRPGADLERGRQGNRQHQALRRRFR